MKITIVGAGQVGTHLAKYLSDERQDIYIIDADSEKLAALDTDYNLMTIVGEPTGFSTLRKAHVEDCDLFIAVTPETSQNIVACATAKSMGAKMTVARVDRYDYMDELNGQVVHRMGVDRVIFPEYIASLGILEALSHSWARNWYEFDNGEIIMVGVRINASAPLVGHYLRDFTDIREHFHVSAIRRNHETIIPRGDQLIEANDILYVTTTHKSIPYLINLAGKENREIRNVLMMGGGKIAELVAKGGKGKFKFNIIDKDADRCRQLAQTCSECEILNGDATEIDMLLEAGIAKTDAFIALSDSSEGNILACLTARDLGVKKTIAEIEREQFIMKGEAFNISTIINKQILASHAIFQLMLDADDSGSKCLAMTDAEVARLEIKSDSALLSAPVKDLRLPKELTFAGLIRNGKGEMVTGNTQFAEGDQVIVFCLTGALHKVEKLFRR
jgi:trk system potassium uptake protein TrkA